MAQIDFSEIGVTGYTRFGMLYESEWLKELSGRKAIQVYKEMKDNDNIVGAILFAIEMLVRQVSWRVEPATEESQSREIAEFVDSCFHDMSISWQDLLADILTMLPFGFSYLEIVYKQRMGDVEDPTKRSKYNDGKIGWRKWALRAQETIQRWEYDAEGGIRGAWQLAPPKYQLVFIPIEKALLFRLSKQGAPEGKSILRNMYRAYYFKKHIEEIEGIGIERDLAGLPVLYVPPEILEAQTPEQRARLEEFKKIIRNIRRDAQEGLILPSIYDEKGNPLYKLELISSAGSRQFDTSEIITRYEQRMATTVMADFLLLGQSQTGSYALSVNKSTLFVQALKSVLDSITDVINNFAIPRLLRLNGYDTKYAPKLVHGEVEAVDLRELAEFISKLANAGMPLFPDEELEKYLKKQANLPGSEK